MVFCVGPNQGFIKKGQMEKQARMSLEKVIAESCCG
jgi:hypothetical protein